jgi:tetratricopeptide (TPR) repeat protein
MALGPGFPTGPGGARPGDDRLQRALAALQGGRPAEAERVAAEILKAEPRQPRALHVLGCALLMQGRAKDAIAPLEDAGRGRHDPEIDTQLAIALREAGRPDEALPKLKRAVKRKPPYPAAFHELGFLLFSMGRYDEAVEALSQGLQIAPMMPELSVQLGYVHLRRRNRQAAKIAFARALAISPSSHDALFGMAMAHSEDGEYAAAAECYRHCLAGRPDDPSLWLNLGHCLLALGQTDAGNDCFRNAARGNPSGHGQALTSLVKSGRGRFWLKPSAAARFFKGG